MARIVGVDIPNEKRVEIALTYIKGIGRNLSAEILGKAGIPLDKRVKDMTEREVGKIRETLEKEGYRLEGELSQGVSLNIKRLKDIGSYRGSRHEKGLPTRGQRTRTNARTKRGKKMTIGGASRSAMRAKASQKT
jgi:small subunit ribosomal protein S13